MPFTSLLTFGPWAYGFDTTGTVRATIQASSGTVITGPLLSIDADGWQATYNGTPGSTIINEALTATNLVGFDATGAATTRSITASFRITRRMRQPGLTSLDGNKVGLSLKMPAGAVVGDAVVASTQVSPVPIVNWASRHGNLIGNEDVVLQIVAGHYYAGIVAGEQIACAEFIITDNGSGSIIKKTSTMTALSGYGDKKTAYGYTVTITAAEMATLANGRIAYNCNVYPFIGTSASIAKTSNATTRGFPTWKFAERYDIKDPIRRATPPRCYLDAAGVDATGVWSDVDATAAASPFLTLAGALAAGKISAIPAGSIVGAGGVDGCEVRARVGTFVISGPATSVPQGGGRIILTRDTSVASRAQAVYNHSTAFRLRVGQTGLGVGCEAGIEFRDVSYLRGATISTSDGFATNTHFVQTDFDMGARNTALANALVTLWYWDCPISNVFTNAGGALFPSSGGAVGIMRGCTGNLNGATTFGYNLIGNSFTNIGSIVPAYSVLNTDNTTICFNINSQDQGTTYKFDATSLGQTITGVLVIGNVSEWTTIVSNPAWKFSSDSEVANTNHVLEYCNSYTGFAANGRHNDRYVDTNATNARTHLWGRSVNNIRVQYNTKHDLYSGGGNLPSPTRIGGWEVDFGVGYNCNWTQFIDAGLGDFAPSYTDPNSQTGTSGTVRLDPLFKINGGTIDGTTPGPGGGDYRLKRISEGDGVNSPCLTIAEVTLLPGFGTVLGAYP